MVSLANYRTQIETAKESGGASKVPSGDYVVVCVNGEEKPNSKRNGHFIQLDFEIQEGEHAGEKLIDRINHDNPNETARNIAFATLKKLGLAIGKKEPMADTSELLGKRIIATVKNVASNREMTDDNGNPRRDEQGNVMYYRDVSITKYAPYALASSVGTTAPRPTGGAFPFPTK